MKAFEGQQRCFFNISDIYKFIYINLFIRGKDSKTEHKRIINISSVTNISYNL